MNFKLTSISSLQLFQLMRFGAFILIGIVFTKTNLGTHSIGEYEQFLFLAGGVSFFWLNGLIRGLLPIAKESRNDGASPVFNSFLLISFFTLLVVALLAFSGNLIGKAVLGGGEIPYLGLLLAYLFFSVPANLIEYFFLLRNEPRRIVYYGAVGFSAMILLVVLPVLFKLDIRFALYGLLLVAFLRYLFLLVLMFRLKETKFSMVFIRKHLGLSVPLIFSALLSGSAQYVDGFIITSRFDEATFAVFRYGARELPLVILLANAFSNAMLPEFSNKALLPASLARIKKESGRLANLLFPISALLILLSHELFPIVFNADFAESATIFNIYLLLIISRLVFPQTILIGLKQTALIARASSLELILNVSLSLMFVRFWGISGVAYATVIAYLFEKIYLVAVLNRRLNIAPISYQNSFRHLFYSLLLLVIFFIVEFVIY
jgi:O-antigen/teichoic acid export membrane protein